ncbi:12044_t:CDS:2, partial [Gigaspora rosea]
NMIPGSVQSLSDLFDKAIKSDQKQILYWYYYSLEFKNKIKSLIADNVNLHKKTERAQKILKLFGEGGADTQIQQIINQVVSKTVPKCYNQVNIEVSASPISPSNPTHDYVINDFSKSNENQKVISIPNWNAHITEPFSSNDISNIEKILSKETRNQVINKLTTHFIDSPKLDKNNSIDTEDSRSKNTYYLHCTNLKEPGILLDDVLKAYSGNSKQIQELKT